MRKEKLEELEGYMDEFRTVSKRLVFSEKKFITSEQFQFCLANKEVIRREKILKNGNDGSAVIILPLTTNNNVLLVVEPRVFTKTGVGIGFPAGYVEEGENPIVSARRELLEETGYDYEELHELVSFYQDEGCSEALNHAYIATGCRKIADQNLDPGEFIRYFECSFDEMVELADLGYIKGSNSLLTIEKAKTYIKER